MNYESNQLFFIATVMWIITGVYWFIAAFNIKKAAQKEKIGFRLLHVFLWYIPGLITFFNIIPIKPLTNRLYPQDPMIEYAAFALTILSLSFMAWSRVTLGRNWSGRIAIKEDHELITSGPYKYVRHPMYTGFLFAFLWSAVLLGEVRGFVSFIAVIFGLMIKLPLEEKFIRENFGTAYEAYAQRVKKIIPFIY